MTEANEVDQPNDRDVGINDVVLLLGRIANALEAIDASLAGKHKSGRAEGTPLSAARKLAKESAIRWFDRFAEKYPEIQFIEDVTPAMMRGTRNTFHRSTYEHIEEVFELAKRRSQ